MSEDPDRKRRKLIGMGFLVALVLSTATIIYTGLTVRAPGSHRAAPTPTDSAEPAEPGTAPSGAETQ